MTGIRRRLDDAGTMGYVVVASAALLAVASIVVTASPGGFVDVQIALAFGAFIALGELVRITLPGGRDAAPIATAGALGYVLITRYPDGPATHSALQVVAVVVVAMLVGVAPHAVVGRAPTVDSLARRLLSIGVAAAVYRGSGLDAEVNTLKDAPLAFIMIGVVIITLVVDAVLAAAVRAGADRAPFRGPATRSARPIARRRRHRCPLALASIGGFGAPVSTCRCCSPVLVPARAAIRESS
jgi:hypothetical protein